jgi:hypothetical protein
VVIEDFGELFGKALGAQQVLHAQAAPRDLVFVGRTDPAPRGTDLLRALGRLARHVQRLVVGQDQRAGLGNAQARVGIHPRRLEFVELLGQRFGGQHDAVADVAGDAVAQDAGRHQVQHRLLAADDQGMAGIVSALKAHHSLGMVGQPIDDLALAFVAPLGADDHDVLCHFSLP